MVTELVVEPMGEQDVGAVVEIERRSFPVTWPEGSFLRELKENRCARYLVARLKGRVVGYAGAWVILEEAHVTTMAIAPEARGKGLGKLLFWHLMDLALREGSKWATLEVRADNQAALRLYRDFGFTRVGLRRRYYADDADAVIMWAGNLQSPAYRRRLERIRKELLG